MGATSSPETLCDIVVPIWNQPELTRRCLESVLARTAEPVRLILVDNGSETPTRELLERFRENNRGVVEILRNEKNLGFIQGVNQGIRAGKAPWVCLLNNDTVVTNGWLSEMIRVAENDPGVGLVNPTSNCMGYPAQGLPSEEIARRLAAERGKSASLSTAIGFCLLARRSLFEKVGLLDEQFGMGNFDDNDLTLRVRQAGLKPVRAMAAYVHHEEKASFRNLPGWRKAFDENRKRFEKKWGRHLRILWALPGAPAGWPETFGKTARDLADRGHWIAFISPEPLPDFIAAQAQISRIDSKGGSWRLPALWRLLVRRRKPFHLVITHDHRWAGWVEGLRWFHRARLLAHPTQNELMEQCQALARPQ